MEDNELTPIMQDYIEAILNLVNDKKVARVKDIAKKMNVTMPSVTGALRRLSDKGYIVYEPYSFLTLTEKGYCAAEKIAYMRNALTDFFVEILGVDRDKAKENACRIEHVIDGDLLRKMVAFSGHIKNRLDLAEIKNSIKEKELRREQMGISLDNLSPGQKGKVLTVYGVNKRILDMGMLPGVVVYVARVAPLGDPIDIKLKGFHLSLRKREARNICVEVIE